MAENETLNTVQEDYIAKIQELKANSVSRGDYDSLRADNKRLLDAIVNGQAKEVNQPKPEPEKVDIQALRDDLYGGRYQGTDLDYISKVLKLRKAVMDAGQPDPGVSFGAKTTATEVDYENCAAVCDTLQEIVDYANGNADVFRSELIRRTQF